LYRCWKQHPIELVLPHPNIVVGLRKQITSSSQNPKEMKNDVKKKTMLERTHKIAENPSSQEQCEHPASIVW
jgi:hypothetical protein